jgi:hypothetical protein
LQMAKGKQHREAELNAATEWNRKREKM